MVGSSKEIAPKPLTAGHEAVACIWSSSVTSAFPLRDNEGSYKAFAVRSDIDPKRPVSPGDVLYAGLKAQRFWICNQD